MIVTVPIIITGLVIAATIIFIVTRYAAAIGRSLLIAVALIVALITASALLSQGAASFKQAQVANNAVKAVKTMATTQTIAVTVGACIFGSLTTTAIAALIAAAILYYRQKVMTDSTSGQRQIVTTPANPAPPSSFRSTNPLPTTTQSRHHKDKSKGMGMVIK
jgi:UPF0716 family protein affecting phage T7 exclusion